jgi:hypothetical protein
MESYIDNEHDDRCHNSQQSALIVLPLDSIEVDRTFPVLYRSEDNRETMSLVDNSMLPMVIERYVYFVVVVFVEVAVVLDAY